MTNGVHVLDPLTDARWQRLVEEHRLASVFHTRGWLDALRRTYGYRPLVVTTTGDGPLRNGLALCEVRTWTGRRRLVSLPFSDHCDPLIERSDDLTAILAFVRAGIGVGTWSSVELRPRDGVAADWAPAAHYCLHVLDLRGPEDRVFDRLHPSSARRAIRRAQREGLTVETGDSEEFLASFYGLLRRTRRRHGLPPQPIEWFHNLAACLPGRLAIHVARAGGRPVAAILTLSFRNTVVYKYGGSDERFHKLGAVPFLFWRVIQDARARGFDRLDLGRSDLDQPGLIAFKEHHGAERSAMTYYRHPARRPRSVLRGVRRVLRPILVHLPGPALNLSGRLLYKHIG